jgi:hypothetical protein
MTVRTIVFAILSLMIFITCNDDERQRPVFEFTVSNPAESGSRFPYLYSEDGETVVMSWLSRIDEGMFGLEYATRTDGRWQEPQMIRMGHDFFTNWADFPSVVSKEGEVVAAHWLKKIEGGPYAYDVQISFPAVGERHWNHITPHDDGTPTEHGFVSMIALDKESVLAIWLDGRHTEHRAHDEYADMDQAMTLRSAIVHRDGAVENERVIDDAVCDCCQTDLVKVDGGAIAVYRDRHEGEIRDISVARYDFESGEWSEPVTVHEDGWQISGCPVNGPRAAADGNNVAVVWYTEAGENEKKVLAAVSDDGGETFNSPMILNTGFPMGRVDIDVAPDGSFYASWMERGDNLARIFLRKIEDGELKTDVILVGNTSLDRNSGFPRIAALNDGIMLAWTQTEPVYRVRTAFYNYALEEHFRTDELVNIRTDEHSNRGPIEQLTVEY